MPKDALVATESVLQLVTDRVARMDLCPKCQTKVDGLLGPMTEEIRARKIERLELEMLPAKF